MSLPGVPFALPQEAADMQSFGMVFWIVVLAAIAFEIAAMWKLFEKAGRPGWAAIVPIYNTIVMIEIGGKPWWWIFLMLIPLVNLILLFVVFVGVAANFGRGTLFAIGLLLLGFIFVPVLAFGPDEFNPAQPA